MIKHLRFRELRRYCKNAGHPLLKSNGAKFTKSELRDWMEAWVQDRTQLERFIGDHVNEPNETS